MKQREHAQLPLRRERRFGFIEQIKSIALETMLKQREECFPVRLPMQRGAPVSSLNTKCIDLRRDIVETFRAQKKAVAGTEHPAFEANEVVQVGMTLVRCKIEILAAALGVEAVFCGDGLQQGGFAG